MKTICILESVSRADGGIFEAECALQRELYLGRGVEIDVVGLEDRFTQEDAPQWLPLAPRAVRVTGSKSLGYSVSLLEALDTEADLVYAATLWKYPSWAALQWAERTHKPMIVAPHGSLDPWALRNAAWKKRIAAVIFKDRQLHKAVCLRALSCHEAESFRAYGLKNPIAIIPNGIELPDFSKHSTLDPRPSTQKTLLFLGRIHPKKGLLDALKAFAKALKAWNSTPDSSPWQFVIAGWDQGGHEAELMKLCAELGLSFSHKKHKTLKEEELGVNGNNPSVLFYGPAFGEEKYALLQSADAFILSSFSEGVPMSVLEAWAYGVPVLMTPECNLPEGFAADAALQIETTVESIAQGLDNLFSLSDADLCSMGERGRRLVEERFTWKKIAGQMAGVYDWVLGGGTPPDFVSAN